MAPAPLLVVTGTGTEIGKTHLASGLVQTWARTGLRVAGVKPIESGVTGTLGEDAAMLGRMSTFHVTRFPPPYMLARAVSPHLAARDVGLTIALDVVADWAIAIRREADAVVLELPGGLFSPLSETATNADLLRVLGPASAILVAPDRLGVLHDVAAATRAARAEGVGLHGIVLTPPAAPDLSTGNNATEIPLVSELPVLATVPRAPSDSPAFAAACAAILERLTLVV